MNTAARLCAYIGALLLAAGSALAVDNIAAGSGNWEDAGTWSQGHAPLATEDVFIPTNITVTINGLATNSINSLSITGTLTHAANGNWPSPGEQHKVILDVAGDVTVASNGLIDVSARGYAVDQGPGTGMYKGGGGEGGWYSSAYLRGPTYGSVRAPTDLGSGGQYVKTGGGVGGGAAVLSVGGTLAVYGAIRADGEDGAGGNDTGGAGGSVFVTAGALAGNGSISAKGGNATRLTDALGGGGSG